MSQSTQKSGEREQASRHAHPFDKLQAVRDLISEEFPEKQAVAIVEIIEDARGGVAMQASMEEMGVAMQASMEEMGVALHSDMRNEIEKAELRLRAEMNSMRADIQAEFKRLYWYIPLVMGAVIGILKFT